MASGLRPLLFRVWRVLPWQVRVFLVRRLTPSYWVGAMCFVERADGAVLLVRQSYRKSWALPGGLLKRNEDPIDAAEREIGEEVGLTVELEDNPKVVVDARSRRVDVIYRTRFTGDEEPSPRSAEILEARWFDPDELPTVQRETAAALVALRRADRPASSRP
ncbi:MAG TPA: NUDIX domain-containing protein [Acidimicrobiales bacterium]|jgi:8-oxo-dGTP diphosphatase|nr:NUDIX domain-containing protein [Acidimicrobiales bacterium]